MPAYFHLLAVHFPIALLVSATLLDWWKAWRGQSADGLNALWLLGVLGAWGAVATGWWNRDYQLSGGWLDTPTLQAALARHQWFSIGASVVFSLVLVPKLRKKDLLSATWGRLLQVIGLALLLVATHLGGSLAHDFF